MTQNGIDFYSAELCELSWSGDANGRGLPLYFLRAVQLAPKRS